MVYLKPFLCIIGPQIAKEFGDAMTTTHQVQMIERPSDFYQWHVSSTYFRIGLRKFQPRKNSKFCSKIRPFQVQVKSVMLFEYNQYGTYEHDLLFLLIIGKRNSLCFEICSNTEKITNCLFTTENKWFRLLNICSTRYHKSYEISSQNVDLTLQIIFN